MSALQDKGVRAELLRAWLESAPGTANAHEEGGFILLHSDGLLAVERWPRGKQDQIEIPSHLAGRRGDAAVVATFHTHPNVGPDYLQEPSPSDVRGVTEDPDLRHREYEGEFVISRETLYLIASDGRVHPLGNTTSLLAAGRE